MSSKESDYEDLFAKAIREARAEAASSPDQDETPFTALAEDRHPRGKVPLHRARNLLKLRRVSQGIITKEISLEVYEDTVWDVLQVATNANKLFNLKSVKKSEAKMPSEHAKVFVESRIHLGSLVAGLEMMIQYAETLDRSDLEEGMQAVEEAMAAISKTQDLALEKAPPRN